MEMMKEFLEEYPPVLNVNQVAKILCVSDQSVRKLIDNHHLAGVRVGRSIRIPKDKLIEYLGKSV